MTAAAPGPDGAPAGAVDFDLHGFVGLRVLGARPDDVATITRQIGPLCGSLAGPPEITVRFVDELPPTGPLTYAQWPDSARAAGEFLLLRGKEGRPGRTLLPLDSVGDHCEIVCERRTGYVPHLLAIINMTALGKGVLPLHASAFLHNGTGVLATGWAKGGKTETLLAFAARGARYVGDEWVYLTPDGQMHGVPEPIRLWDWHVAQLPRLRAELPRVTRTRLAALPAVASGASTLGRALSGLPASALRRAAPVIRRQAYVQVPPARLFGEDAIALHGPLDHLFLVTSHDRDDVTIEPVPGAHVAAVMRASLEEERAAFLEAYRQFRYLFPDRRSATVEAAAATERNLLHDRLSGRPAHVLGHPYPVRLDSLVAPVESILAARAR